MDPAGGVDGATCGGNTDPYGVIPSPAGTPGDGAGAAPGTGADTGAAAGAAATGALSTDAVNGVIGACGTVGTAPAAVTPAANPRPKSIPNDGTAGGVADDAKPPAPGIPPPGKPPKPPNKP